MKRQAWVTICRERRFLIGPFFLILVLGFYFDLQEKGATFYDLLDQEKSLALELLEKEQAFRQASPLVTRLQQLRGGKLKQPLLEQVIQAAAFSRCKLASMQSEL